MADKTDIEAFASYNAQQTRRNKPADRNDIGVDSYVVKSGDLRKKSQRSHERAIKLRRVVTKSPHCGRLYNCSATVIQGALVIKNITQRHTLN